MVDHIICIDMSNNKKNEKQKTKSMNVQTNKQKQNPIHQISISNKSIHFIRSMAK